MKKNLLIKQMAVGILSLGTLAAQSTTINELPSREFGQAKLLSTLTSAAPNLAEGRELNGPSAIAFDTTVSPPILYVADTGNNRVMAWRNPSALSGGNMADKVIGQRDMNSTVGQGPGTALSTGLATPVAVAVDSSGNLYVADAGNNRIVRYPAPFRQTGELLAIDLVIGQKSVGATSANSNNIANQGLPAPTNRTIALATGQGVFRAALIFDQQGNLWFTDAANNRVLRYPASVLAPNTQEPGADVVLGQVDFVSNGPPVFPNNTQTNKSGLFQPSGLAFDQSGRLYVADNLARVLFYAPPYSTGSPASRVLGVRPTPSAGQIPVAYPNATTLGNINTNGGITGSPQGLFTVGNYLFVADTPQHRVVRYDVPESWPPETNASPSPNIAGVVGQIGYQTGKVNRGSVEPDAGSFNSPTGGAALNDEVWVVDTGNHRVLGFPSQGGQTYTTATKVLGQLDFSFNAPNIIEGRELFLNSAGFFTGSGMVIDKTSTPPRLYVADAMNNRVLGFKDARAVGTDSRSILNAKADLVIGQPDLLRAIINYPSGDSLSPTDTGLVRPAGLAVDGSGNLYVADSGNGRVLRFPSPFRQQGGIQRANLVLGQGSFSTKIQDASSSTLNTPFGLAFLSDGSLAVSDAIHNRVLLFRKPGNGDFTNGQAASTVFGQSDFTSTGASNGPGGLNSPRHIAADTSDRLYVADSQNSRFVVFTRANNSPNGAPAALGITGFNSPQGITVSAATGEIWVADTLNNRIIRFPEFQTLIFDPSRVTSLIASAGPIALGLDPFDNVVVAEATNRVTFYFAKLTFQHAASYSQQPMAPGMLAYLYRLGKDFAFTPAAASSYPWPTVLGDLQISVNGIPGRIYRVNASRIDFQVPQNAPISGTAEFVVTRPSTGEIVAAATLQMAPSSPGFFTTNQAGTGQVAALNDDGITPNGPASPIGRGKVISLFLTGMGQVVNGPSDGMPPSGLAPTPVKPRISFVPGPASFLPDDAVQYSGMGAFPGGWQINVKVPEDVPPSNNVAVVLTMYDTPSNLGPTGRIVTTIAVK